MIVIVCGGRDYKPTAADTKVLLTLLRYLGASTVMHGGARGVDEWACDVAGRAGFPTEEMYPDYKVHPPSRAPLIRNHQMALAAKPGGVCIAFPGGSGTQHMVRAARSNSLRIIDLR